MSVIIAPSHPTPLIQHQSLVQSRVNVSMPPPHPTPCNILRKVQATWPKEGYNIPTPPHVSIASTSCAWSREHGRGNVNIPTPFHLTPSYPNKYRLRNYQGFRNYVSETIYIYIYIRFRNWKFKIQKLRLGNCTFTIQKLCWPDSETRNSRFRNYVSENANSRFRNFACPIQKQEIQDSETTSQKLNIHDSETWPPYRDESTSLGTCLGWNGCLGEEPGDSIGGTWFGNEGSMAGPALSFFNRGLLSLYYMYITHIYHIYI